MVKFDFKFSEGDVIVYKETDEWYCVAGIERAWNGRFNYLLLDRNYRMFLYDCYFVEKKFDYKKESPVSVEKEEYDFATTLMEYSM